jgi:hypothetical protein
MPAKPWPESKPFRRARLGPATRTSVKWRRRAGACAGPSAHPHDDALVLNRCESCSVVAARTCPARPDLSGRPAYSAVSLFVHFVYFVVQL